MQLKKLAAILRLGERNDGTSAATLLRQRIRKVRKNLSELRDAALIEKMTRSRTSQAPVTVNRARKLILAARDELIAIRTKSSDKDWTWLTWEKIAVAHAAAYRRWRKAMKQCGKSEKMDDFHRWRRRTKELYYQRSALRNQTPLKRLPQLKALGRQLGRLQDCQVLLRHKAMEPSSGVAAARRGLLQKCANYGRRALRTGALCDRGSKRKFLKELRRKLSDSRG